MFTYFALLQEQKESQNAGVNKHPNEMKCKHNFAGNNYMTITKQ